MEISITDLRGLMVRKLRELRFTQAEARIIADEYLAGELKGKRTHSVLKFMQMYRRMAKTPPGKFRVTKNAGSYAYIDGRGCVGQLAAHRAITLAVAKAKKAGIAMVGGGNVLAFLRPGTWAEYVAKKGMIALCFNYGGGPLIAPTGSSEAVLSTNPIGIGIPYSPDPIVIDMATSERAYSYVDLAKALGLKLHGRWAIDKSGKVTNDPAAVASVLPFGGYKGYALTLALEILTGPLVRNDVGKRTKLRRGFLFIVIDPLAFTTRVRFNREVRQLLREVKRAKRLPEVASIALPGEHSFAIERRNLRRGSITVDARILEELRG